MNISKITITKLNKTITNPSNCEVSKILHSNIKKTNIDMFEDITGKSISQMLQDSIAETSINSMRTNAVKMYSRIVDLMI